MMTRHTCSVEARTKPTPVPPRADLPAPGGMASSRTTSPEATRCRSPSDRPGGAATAAPRTRPHATTISGSAGSMAGSTRAEEGRVTWIGHYGMGGPLGGRRDGEQRIVAEGGRNDRAIGHVQIVVDGATLVPRRRVEHLA